LEATQVVGYPEGQLPTLNTARQDPDLPARRRRPICRLAGEDFQYPLEEISIMAVPKRRMSRSNTRSRRSQWKAKRTELVGVTVAGQQHKVPRRLLKAARLGLIDLDRR
jgi:large subunit ribosomal protein L32